MDEIPTLVHLGNFFDHHSAVMLLIDPITGRIKRANAAAQFFYGYSEQQFQELTIDKINSLSPEEIEHEMNKAVAHKLNYFTFRHRLASGEIRDVEVYSSPIEYDGKTCLFSIITDIGERIRAEQSAQKIEAEYQSLFDLIPEGVYRSTPEGRLLAANPALVLMLGYDSADEILKVDMARQLFVEPAERARMRAELETQGKLHNYPIRLRRKDGVIIQAFDNSHAVQDENGKVMYYVGSLTDVTDLRQTESFLRESEERYRAAFEYAAVGVSETDLDGHYLRVNDKLCEITGYARHELLAMRYQDITHPDDMVENQQKMRELLTGEVPSFAVEKRMLCKNGKVVWVSLSASLIRDETGRPLHSIAVIQNIHEQKQAREALAHHLNELELLYENSLTISMSLEPRQIARQMISLIDRKMHWHHVAIRQYHPYTNRLEILALNIPEKDEAYIRQEEDRLNVMITHPGQGLSGWVIRTGEVVRSGSVQDDPRYTTTYTGLQSGLYVPMKVGDRIVGSIAVESEDRDAFSESDERLLVTLAAQAAVAIDNARLFIEVQDRVVELEALYATTRNLMVFKDFHSLLNSVARQAASLMNVNGAGIYLYDANAEELELVNVSDGSSPLGIRLKMGEGLSGLVARSRQPLVVSDYQQWENRSSKFDGPPYHSMMGVPMIYSGELVGVLEVFNIEKEDSPSASLHVFNENDLHLVSLLASAAAGAVYGSRMFEQVNRRAEELSAISRVSSALRSASTRVQMMPVILDQLMDLLPADGSFLAFAQPPNDDLMIELARGSVAGLTAYTLPGGKGISGQVLMSRQPFTSADVRGSENFLRLEGTEKVRAIIVVPLMAQEQVMGVLSVCRDVRPDGSMPEPFTERQQRLTMAIADMAANALHRAALHEQTALHADQMAAVSRLGRLLAESTDLSTIYSRLSEGIYDLLPDINGMFISLYDVEAQLIRCAYGHMDGMELDTAQLQPIPFNPSGGGKQIRVIDTHQPLIINNQLQPVGPVQQFVGNPNKISSSALYVPMLTDGRTIGLIQVTSYTPGRFSSKDTELLSVVANTAAVEIENARLIARFERHVQRLTALHAIDTAINSSTDMRLSLRVALEQATHLLNMDAASVLLINPITLGLEFAVGSGFRFSKPPHASIRLGEGLAGRAALQRTLVQSSDPKEIAACFTPMQYEQERFVSYLALPLVSKGRVSGVLQIFSRTPIEADQEWLNFLHVLGDQVALAVNNANLYDGLERANIELTMAYDATIEGWSRALDLRDHETEGHTQRVTELTITLARVMGLPEQSIPHIRRGTLLHDIGKMGVPDDILRKPGPLTEEEWKIMRQHPRLAYDLLSPIIYLRTALDIPYCHHEKWDGSGYPRGLKGDTIPLTARIFAIVDVYDALTSDRPYHSAMPLEKALDLIQNQSGKHFDPHVVEVFMNFVNEHPEQFH